MLRAILKHLKISQKSAFIDQNLHFPKYKNLSKNLQKKDFSLCALANIEKKQ